MTVINLANIKEKQENLPFTKTLSTCQAYSAAKSYNLFVKIDFFYNLFIDGGKFNDP